MWANDALVGALVSGGLVIEIRKYQSISICYAHPTTTSILTSEPQLQDDCRDNSLRSRQTYSTESAYTVDFGTLIAWGLLKDPRQPLQCTVYHSGGSLQQGLCSSKLLHMR